ncbi:hypothetical protein ACNKF0_09460 [Nocardioides sp. T5]|uniref:hypothetical protein n=1 Tax=Nocardioides sp. T5 TaxID=3400182 RepID=UPI003A8BF57E
MKSDLASFSSAGYGTLRVPAGSHPDAGQVIAVTDDEADTLEAEVLAVNGDKAEVRVHWDRIVRGA